MLIFEDIVEYINKQYELSGNQLGWRFLSMPKERIIKNNGIYLITLNPGGNKIPADHPISSSENGCAYIIESWNGYPIGDAPLQKQIQGMFYEIAFLTKSNYSEVINQALIGHFIPFRSPSYKELKYKEFSIQVGRKIWQNIITENIPSLIICIDNVTFNNIGEILSIDLKFEKIQSSKMPIGWGSYCADVTKWKDGNNRYISMIRFPHPSRFSIFGRIESIGKIRNVFSEALC